MTEAQELFARRLKELRQCLSSPIRFDHLKVAALLRQLLVDGDALAHHANRNVDKRNIVKLEFVVNNFPPFTDSPVSGGTHFHGLGIDPQRIKIPAGTKALSLDGFLKLPMVQSTDLTVSVREVIKFAANVKGGVHFRTKRRTGEQEMEQKFAMASGFGIDGMKIALQAIAGVASASLEPLRAQLVALPKSLPLFGHYKLADPGFMQPRISFDGITQLLVTEFAKPSEILDGFSFDGVLRISKQKATGERVIYSIGELSSGGFRLWIWFDGNALGATAILSPDSVLKTSIPSFDRSKYFENFFHLGVDLQSTPSGTQLRFFLNGRLVAHAKDTNFRNLRAVVSRQTFGAQLDGSSAAAMEAQEVILVRKPLSRAERIEINRYLALEWGA